MLRNPRCTRTSGLSTQGILLAVAGLGTAVFLCFLFPRMSSSRAAAPKVESVKPVPVPEKKKAPRPVDLPDPMTGLVTPSAPEPQAQGATTAGSAMLLAAAAATAPATASADGEANAARKANEKPKVEGPSLNYAKREGKPEVLERSDLKARNKDRAKERLEKATEKAIAEGGPLPVDRRAAAKASGGDKPVRPNAKGKKKPAAKPKDG